MIGRHEIIAGLLALVLVFFLAQSCKRAWGQHPAHEQDLHLKFYWNWQKPDLSSSFSGRLRNGSCCNNLDCHPTKVRWGPTGYWEAWWDERGRWVQIGRGVIEEERPDPRESPDGESHACITKAGNVVCAVRGAKG